jgi:hypothetical protein
VTGVQAEPDLAAVAGTLVDRVPQPGDGVKRPGHRPVTARGVLDQHRQRPLDTLGDLAPILGARGGVGLGGDVAAVHDQPARADRRGRLELLLEQLTAGDTNPVVGARDVDHVGRVNVDVHPRLRVRVPDSRRIATRDDRPLPPLRVAEEELRRVRSARGRLGQRVVNVEMPSDSHHATEPSPLSGAPWPGAAPAHRGCPARIVVLQTACCFRAGKSKLRLASCPRSMGYPRSTSCPRCEVCAVSGKN